MSAAAEEENGLLAGQKMKVFLFPGQGSQEIAMGADLFKSDSAFRGLVALASELVGEDLESLCLRGREKELVRTKYLQPLLVAVSLGYLRHLTERGLQPDLVLGHSLGEITALAAAGVATPEEVVRIAVKRGGLMEEAAAKVDGAMLAVTLEERSRLADWLASAQAKDRVILANDNAPSQVVLSGERAALAGCAEFIAAEKLGRCRLLSVSGPWHSPFMAEAAARFDAWLRQMALRPPRVPMLFNLTAAGAETAEDVCSSISGVLARPVRWSDCMSALCKMNPPLLLEVGPGRVLSGLARANGLGNPTQILNIGNLRGVALAVQAAADLSACCRNRPPLLASGP